MYGQKIRAIRELRNFSQEYMADKLSIKQNSYSKIENSQIKLSTEMLQKISEVLEVSPMDIMNFQPEISNFTYPQQGYRYIQSFVSDQKDTFEKVIISKDKEIERLHQLIEILLKDKERIMNLLEKIQI